MHRSTRPPQGLRHHRRPRRHRSARRRGPHPRAHRSQRRRQDHRAQRDPRPHPLPGRTEGARARSLDRARSAHARRLPSSPTSPCCRAGCASRRRSTTSPACIRDSIAPRRRAFWPRPTSSAPARSGNCRRAWSTQLHLALVMAIDARLLVLDEPTLGLDILFRKQFYDSLLNDYFDRSRTIVVTTHQVEEIQHVLTDLMFINRGRIVLDCSMEDVRVALRRSDGASRASRRRAGAEADSRAPGLRPQHPALRRRRPASSSPRSATCARPASPTCSSP